MMHSQQGVTEYPSNPIPTGHMTTMPAPQAPLSFQAIDYSSMNGMDMMMLPGSAPPPNVTSQPYIPIGSQFPHGSLPAHHSGNSGQQLQYVSAGHQPPLNVYSFGLPPNSQTPAAPQSQAPMHQQPQPQASYSPQQNYGSVSTGQPPPQSVYVPANSYPSEAGMGPMTMMPVPGHHGQVQTMMPHQQFVQPAPVATSGAEHQITSSQAVGMDMQQPQQPPPNQQAPPSHLGAPMSQGLQSQASANGPGHSTQNSANNLNLPIDKLKEALLHQLEYYFSRENLAHDAYLISQMDADQYVEIEIIARFNQIKKLTTDVSLVTQVLRSK